MPTVNYLSVIDCEHDAAKSNEKSYRKGRRNGKKLMKAYVSK